MFIGNREGKHNQIIRSGFVVLIMMVLIQGLSALPGDNGSYQLEDMRGRSVSIPKNVNTIIALGAGSLRLVTYLEAVDKVIAVEDVGPGQEKTVNNFFSLATYRLAYPELRDLPSIGSAENHEGIIAANPDLVISSTIDTTQLDQLQSVLGIPVFAVNVDVELYDTDLFYKQLEALGKILDREKRAEELVSGIADSLSDIEKRKVSANLSKKAYAGGMMFYGPADLFRTTGDFIPFDFSGTINVMPTNPTGNRQPYMTSLEDLIAASPDYVFMDAANINLAKSGFESNRSILEEQVPAFKSENVYTTLVYKYYGTNWENQLINVYYTGKILYQDNYADINIRKKSVEIWKLFFNKTLNYDSIVKQQKTGLSKVDWF